MGQTSYSFDAIIAQPGQPFDGDIFPQDRVSRICSVVVPFGTLCEMDSNGNAEPVQSTGKLAGTVTVTNGSASITFTSNQTLSQGQALVFSDQPGVVYYLAAAIANTTAGTLTVNYSGTGGAGKTAATPWSPKLVGIAVLNPMADEEDYVPYSVPTTLSGTVTVTNNSTSLTFTVAQTLAAGVSITFSDQPGVIYYIATATTASTSATLVTAYTGAGGSGKTATTQSAAGLCKGFKQGRVGSFMRKGRIWVLGDGTALSGTPPYGALNVNHSTTTGSQGIFTTNATSMTVGSEVDVAPGVTVYEPAGAGGTGASVQVTDSLGNVFNIYPVEISI